MRHRRRPATVRAVAVITCALAAGAGGTAVVTTADAATGDGRQRVYAAAAARYGVPERVLLGVSYLESRWDSHQGPSTSGGYGPMHLTDLAAAGTRPARWPRAGDDLRGDLTRPVAAQRRATPAAATPGRTGASGTPAPAAEGTATLSAAAALTGVAADELKRDPAANIDGGAALLARYQRELGAATGVDTDPAIWYPAVARYSGADDLPTAQAFADEVFDVIATGVTRRTNDGHLLRLRGGAVRPDRSRLGGLGLRNRVASTGDTAADADVECPRTLGCEWIPATYALLGDGTDPTYYWSYDKGVRPEQQKIEYIVIHDIEGSYDAGLSVLEDPNAWTSWHYTVRSTDGHVAQHVKVRDVPWQAGNWYINTKSIGIEHEGYAADGTWYTETLYRSSAKLVRYLAGRYGVPLDRAHIIGHDNVPGLKPASIPNMHWDPGPYWDWDHYMALLGAPLAATGRADDAMVMIKPDYASNTAPFFGCPAGTTDPCVDTGLSTLVLHSAPSEDAPLLPDPGLHRRQADPAAPSTMDVADLGARVSTGQRYAVAETRGDWTAIWYNGFEGWLRNPPSAPTAVRVKGKVVTPKPGRDAVTVYGGAFAEDAAYPEGVTPGDSMLPLDDYVFAAGQRYSYAGTVRSESYRSKTFDGSQPGDWTVFRGATRYVQIQFGHRIGFVNADDVDIVDADTGR